VLRPELAVDPVQAARFVARRGLLMDLRHPHLVKGLRVAKEGETIFFAMEQVPGRELLQDVLAEEGGSTRRRRCRSSSRSPARSTVLHETGLVHRDVKPGNILWSEERGAVLIDLGFAVARDRHGSDTTAGTVHYIAPEQARGRRRSTCAPTSTRSARRSTT
jgi:serine/threonine protein kinase